MSDRGSLDPGRASMLAVDTRRFVGHATRHPIDPRNYDRRMNTSLREPQRPKFPGPIRILQRKSAMRSGSPPMRAACGRGIRGGPKRPGGVGRALIRMASCRPIHDRNSHPARSRRARRRERHPLRLPRKRRLANSGDGLAALCGQPARLTYSGPVGLAGAPRGLNVRKCLSRNVTDRKPPIKRE